MNRRPAPSAKWLVLLTCGLWASFEQWCRVMLPFAQWQLIPRPDLHDTLVLNALANGAIFAGSFIIAQMIASIGVRRCAILSTVCTGIFQVLHAWVQDYYLFGALQLLLFFNHMPTIVDVLIARLAATKAEHKERTRLIMQTQIPLSIAFAAGPFLAVQLLYTFHPGLQWTQSMCGLFHLLSVLPILILALPIDERDEKSGDIEMFGSGSFGTLLKDSMVARTLLFILLIAAPYNAYDQVIRLHLTGYMLTKPNDMAFLAFLLGAAALIANMAILPLVQRHATSRRIVQLGLGLMVASYLYLVHYSDYYHIMAGMTLQVVGTSLSLGQLSAQLMSSVPRNAISRVAALNRITQLAASLMCPLLTGHYVDHEEAPLLCYVNTAICVCTILLVEVFGAFMERFHTAGALPTTTAGAHHFD